MVAGNLLENPLDSLVLTRFLDQPEFIFNQNLYEGRFFNKPEQAVAWQLRTDCYISQKNKLVAIFFDRENAEAAGYKLIDCKKTVDYLKTLLDLPKTSPKCKAAS